MEKLDNKMKVYEFLDKIEKDPKFRENDKIRKYITKIHNQELSNNYLNQMVQKVKDYDLLTIFIGSRAYFAKEYNLLRILLNKSNLRQRRLVDLGRACCILSALYFMGKIKWLGNKWVL